MGRINKKWSKEENEYLKENYLKESKDVLIEKLNRSANAIYKQARVLGIVSLKYNKEYKYEVGEVINNKTSQIKITKQIRMDKGYVKGYEYICLNDNYIGEINEYNALEGKGCPVCENKKVLKGVNDIATTNPEYIKYFKNKDDSNKYTVSSGKSVMMICPNCKKEKEYKIATIVANRFSCDFCSDGVSYGEKFVAEVLNQMDLNFISQFTSEWCVGKRYDFYIPDKGTIIEVHGMQHYEDKKFNMKGARSLEQEKMNDLLKKDLALSNGFTEKNYIVIDSRYSNKEYLRDEIVKNDFFKDKIEIGNINWDICEKATFTSKMIQSCNLYNKGCTTKDIAEILNVSRDTVRKWLNKCTKENMCVFDGKFNANNGGSKRVKNGDVIYNSISHASRTIGVTRRKITNLCDDKNNKEWEYVS